MFNLKTALIGAAAGFALSFIAGIIGRVDFWVVLLRALLSAAFSSLLFSAIRFLYVHFLADVQTETPAAGRSKPSPSGSVVDITLDDTELPDTDTAPDFIVDTGVEIPYKEKSDGQSDKQVIADTDKQADGAGGVNFVPYSLAKADAAESVPDGFPASQSSFKKQIADEKTSLKKTEIAQADDSGGGDGDQSAESLDEIDEDGNEGTGEPLNAAGATVLDALPDLGSFTPQEHYVDEHNDALLLNDQSEDLPLRSKQTDIAVDLSDSKNIAAAIRTALQKDS